MLSTLIKDIIDQIFVTIKLLPYDQWPDSVAHAHVRLKVEKLDPAALIVPVKHNSRAPDVVVTLDDDCKEGAEHASSLND